MADARTSIMRRLRHVRSCRDRNPHRASVYDAQERLLVTLLRKYQGRYREGLEIQLVRLLAQTPLGQHKLCQLSGGSEHLPAQFRDDQLRELALALKAQGHLRELLQAALEEAADGSHKLPPLGPGWAQTKAQARLILDLAGNIE